MDLCLWICKTGYIGPMLAGLCVASKHVMRHYLCTHDIFPQKDRQTKIQLSGQIDHARKPEMEADTKGHQNQRWSRRGLKQHDGTLTHTHARAHARTRTHTCAWAHTHARTHITHAHSTRIGDDRATTVRSCWQKHIISNIWVKTNSQGSRLALVRQLVWTWIA